jgi:hypothetical protein
MGPGLPLGPSREFAINAVWLQLALTAADLVAWTQTILLTRDIRRPENRTPGRHPSLP